MIPQSQKSASKPATLAVGQGILRRGAAETSNPTDSVLTDSITHSERGSATITIAFLTLALLVGGWIAISIGTLAAKRSAASSAADMAALAGAAKWTAGATAMCAAAGRSATHNRALLQTCAVNDSDIEVKISMDLPPAIRTAASLAGKKPGKLIAIARAGPDNCHDLNTATDLCNGR